MKKTFTLCLFALTISFFATAAGPTVPSSNIQFPVASIDGDRLQVTFNKGNGAFRIIVMKEASAIVSVPVNGKDYTANAMFGTVGSEFASNDGYVVYRGSSGNSSITQNITGLKSNTTYYVSIYEFNGTGAATEYLLTALSGNATTKTTPAGQASIISYTNVTGNKLTLNFSAGTGDRRLVIARKANPVTAAPQNFTDYTVSSIFGNSPAVNGNNYPVYKGTGTTVTITNLEPNTTYYFAIFEYNGNLGPVYLTPGNEGNKITTAGPTQASGTINFSLPVEGNRLTMSFPTGNGAHQLIIARKGQAVTAVPVNGQTYTASTVFGSGTAIATGEYVMNTLNNDRTFTNLDPASVYYFRIYDYDIDINGNTFYFTGSYSEGNKSTAVTPAQVTDVRFENVTGSTATIKYTQGASDFRLIVMKEGSPVDASPADLTKYTLASAVFGQGQALTPGNFVITGGTNTNTLNVTGLTPGTTYYVAVFAYNGNNYPVYARPAGTASAVTPNQPSAAGQNFQTNTIEGNSFRAQWSGGDGARRIVIARKGAAVTASPVDGTTYTGSADFGDGDQIAAEQFIVYDGTARVIPVQNLAIGSTYHFAVFEYNMSAGVPDYLTSSFLTGTGTTVAVPALQTKDINAGNIQNTQATINFTVGNGSNRMFIIRAGSPVNVEPQDLQSYSASTTYGAQQIGTGNYVVQKTGGNTPFTITSLSPATHYYIAAFELNGSLAPVYMRPGVTYDFTTTGNSIITPVTNATSPVFDIPDGNKLNLSWSNGDGAKRIVVIRAGAPVGFTPVDGVDYVADPVVGNGVNLGNNQYVVANGIGNSVIVTNLSPATIYHFAVFEYNGNGITSRYLVAGALITNKSTATSPTTVSTGVTGIVNNLTLDLSWNNGAGTGRIVVMKEGTAITGTPADLSKYPYSTAFKTGSQIATGEYVVYAGNSAGVTVTGLENNKTYYYTVFEYNGVDAPVYNTTNVTSNSSVISASLPLKWLYFTAKEENNTIHLDWGTAEEFNTRHFVIERSQGNGNFSSIGTIQAKGSDIRNEYSFIDNSKPPGVVSYRIKQVDIDNHFEYSKQVVIQPAGQQSLLKLYPNPADGQTRISLPQGMQQSMLRIYTVTGALIKTSNITNGELLSLEGLKPGIYQVVVTNNGNRYAEKLVIR